MIQQTTNQNDIYFAAREAEACASELLEKSRTFFQWMESNSYIDKLRRMWSAYHGAYNDGYAVDHKVNFTGEQGELVQIPINHFRNIAQHIYVMITSNRPVMEARAINSDAKSYAQTVLANGILDYYMRQKGLEAALKKATELAIVLGSGYVKLAWNATGGDIYETDPDTNEPIYEGELEFSTLTPLDVVVDGTKENWDNDWIVTRVYKNRFDLVAKYPQLKDKILGLPTKTDSSVYRISVFSNDKTDDIPVYEFFHRKTESMPEGRYMLFASSDCVLIDSPMPYDAIPVFRIAPSDILGTPYGYSPMFDIFPIQEGINSLYGTIMTNQNAFGVQSVYVPRGSDVSVNQVEGGLNFIEANAPPQPLQLTATPAEVFKFLETLISAAETISGVNSVARGNPEASLKSGTALALVQSQALQFISGLQASYVKLVEDVGTSIIKILQQFAYTPKLIAIVGKYNKPLLKEFTGDKISDVDRVVVDMGNPLSRTIAGRVQMAEQMLQMKIIQNPRQYFQVLNTGRLDATFEGDESELILMKMENEKILDGVNPLVSPMDRHSEHIQEHKSVLSDPDLREKPELIKVLMDHIQGHMDALRNTDPALLGMIGENPLPPIQSPNQGQPPQQNVPAGAAGNSPNGPILSPAAGQTVVGGQGMQGPGVTAVNPAQPAQVPASALANPALQEQAMGNVNMGR